MILHRHHQPFGFLVATAVLLLGVAVTISGRAPASLPQPAEISTASIPADPRVAFRGPLPAEVLRTIDGDTFEARVRVWFGQEVRSSIRIRGFDAPERAAACPSEARGAQEATDMLKDILASGPITLTDIAPDKYFGRVVSSVRVRLADGIDTDVASLMLAAGQGRPYTGGHRDSWCGQMAAAG
jgi:endonuclease YncB( thermonuclease family)